MSKILFLHNQEVREGRFSDLGQRGTTVWVDLSDPAPAELEAVAAHVGVSAEELGDFLHENQRPVLQDIGKFTAVVFHAPETGDKKTTVKPHLLLASKEQKDFISLHPGVSQAVQKIWTYSQARLATLFQKGSTALLFAVLNEMVSSGFDGLDLISEEISRLEEQVFEPKGSSGVMPRIFRVKKDLIYLQRSLTSDREVVSEIEKAYGAFLDRRELSRFRLLYSDITGLIELSATYRDILISAVEVHLSAISNNLNVIMKRLTAWAAIILVPSLVAGIYGMNFLVLPLSRHPAGFWYILGVMALAVWILHGYFKRNDWI